jgi:hypothetical protein
VYLPYKYRIVLMHFPLTPFFSLQRLFVGVSSNQPPIIKIACTLARAITLLAITL